MDKVRGAMQYEFRNPYAQPQPRSGGDSRVDGGPWEEVIHTYDPVAAPHGSRLLAALIDALLYGLASAPLVFATSLYPVDLSPTSMRSTLLLVTVVAVISLSVCNVLQLHRQGQTLGKHWLGLRIVRRDGSEAGLLRLVLRTAMAGLFVIPWFGPLLMLLDALGSFGTSRRGWRDRLTDTLVVAS